MTSSSDKNESSRFLGDGVSFRAKLIGVLEVAEARGDRMCQDALADLKMAVRAAGEHKQRIQVHVAIDGLRLRDDKTGDSLYHHPVHKISFIAQDMSDSRAFGYIFGSPDTGHRFFGIKTDKAAGHVVIAMRDLFQVVFELKKKEIELARQQLENKTTGSSSVKHQDSSEHGQSLGLMRWPILQTTNGETSSTFKLSEVTVKTLSGSRPPGLNLSGTSSGSAAVAELVDLEQELSSLRRGLNEMEGLAPKDPFGDSFAGPSNKGLLPPPPKDSRDTRTRGSTTGTTVVPSDQQETSVPPFSPAKTSIGTFSPRHSIDKTSLASSSILSKIEVSEEKPSSSQIFDVFTELDPLGTGRSKPYIDKKHFFQELKNPPKKVLKDLVPGTVPSLLDSSINFVPSFDSTKPDTMFTATSITSVGTHSGGSVTIAKTTPTSQMFVTPPIFTADPFVETDPFDSTDPFSDSQKDDPFASAPGGFSLGHFRDLGIGKGNLPLHDTIRDQTIDDNGRVKFIVEPLSSTPKSVFNGPLQVSLPPEPLSKSPRLPRQASESQASTIIRQRPQISKQQTIHSSGSAPSPPPPLPPKKNPLEIGALRPPPRPPHAEYDYHDPSVEPIPPIPNPSRKWGTEKSSQYAERPTKASLSSTGPDSNDDEYLTPIPPPLLPGCIKRQPELRDPSPGLDITLSQLLTCSMDELAIKLNVPSEKLSNMTILQLTAYLREYLETNKTNGHWHGKESSNTPEIKEQKDFKANFEDNFAQDKKLAEPFVANFDKFCINNSATYDRYAAFREIQELELKTQQSVSSNDNDEGIDKAEDEIKNTDISKVNTCKSKNSLEVKESFGGRHSMNSSPRPSDESGHFLSLNTNEKSPERRSPLKSLDELAFDSLGAFTCIGRASVSPKSDSKLMELKTVISNLHKSSHSPKPETDNATVNDKHYSDKYAALRDITTIEVTADNGETAVPPDGNRERKKSDERSDGFDNSDFFDCIDNSSLSFSHGEEALRKSPLTLKGTEKDKRINSPVEKSDKKLDADSVVSPISPSNLLAQPPPHLSAGSLSDIVSGSSPEIGAPDKSRLRHHASGGGSGAGLDGTANARRRRRREGDDVTWQQQRRPPREVTGSSGEAWSAFSALRNEDDGASPWSSDSGGSPPLHGNASGIHNRWSPHGDNGEGDVSPPPTIPRPRRRTQHSKTWHTKQTSSSSRDVSPWDEDPPKTKIHLRPQHMHRERKDSANSKDRHDSGSGRDKDVPRERRDSGSGRDREHRERNIRREHERVRHIERDPNWDRNYDIDSVKDRDVISREKPQERHRRRHHSWDDDDGYSDGKTSHTSGGGRRYSPSGAMSGASSGCSAGRSTRDLRDSRREPWQGDRDYMDDDRVYATVARSSRRRGDSWQFEETARYGNILSYRGRRSGSARSRESRNSDSRSHNRHQHYYHRPPRSPFEDDFAPPNRYAATPSPRSDRESPHTSHQSRQFPEADKRPRQYYENTAQAERESPVTVAAKNLPARFRFSNDFSEKESLKSQHSPFDNDFIETPSSASFKKSTRYTDGTYSSFDKESPIVSKLPGFGKFKFDNDVNEENFSASPSSVRHNSKQTHSLLHNEDSPTPHGGKFKFDSEQSPTQRSLFEDDFSPEPRNGILRTSEQSLGGCGGSIAEEDENNLDKTDKNVVFDFGSKEGVSRQESKKSHNKFKARSRQEIDLKKSESINIFARDKDPFDGDEFFSCTSSNKAATKEKWPGDFANFDDV